MKTRTAILPIFILSATLSFAQEGTSSSYSRDIGFNTTFIFEGILNSGATPFTLMYKKYVSENKANRFGIDLSLSLDDVDDSGQDTYSETSYAMIRLNIGREIHKAITSKWTWFYGGDLIPFYSFTDQTGYQNNLRNFVNNSSSMGLTLRPFIAIRFNINPRLYLSAEASLNLTYRRQEQQIEYPLTNTLARDAKSTNISLGAQPANGLFLFYRF